jgi:hypothetical protein
MIRNKIIVLGFRADTRPLNDVVNMAVKSLGYSVNSFNTRCGLKSWLDSNAELVREAPDFCHHTGISSFPAPAVQTDAYTESLKNHPANQEMWFPYRADNIGLFICSDITRDGNGEDAEVVNDGHYFAKNILPETPLIALHYFSKFRAGSALPDKKMLEFRCKNNIYHLLRDCSEEHTRVASDAGLMYLTVKLCANDFKVPFSTLEEAIELQIK